MEFDRDDDLEGHGLEAVEAMEAFLSIFAHAIRQFVTFLSFALDNYMPPSSSTKGSIHLSEWIEAFFSFGFLANDTFQSMSHVKND